MTDPQTLKARLGRHMLADGMELIADLTRSSGSWLVDKRDGSRYLDCFSMFASMAVGFNHPRLLANQDLLGRVAVQKPANSDSYSEYLAEFLETFSRLAMPDYLGRAFFIEGGALAVENALKAAFDWKVRKNKEAGDSGETGTAIIHFRQAFHGRSGYTLSLTNTADPRKTQYFPKFNWPRITNPKLTFPLTQKNLDATIAQEQKAEEEILTAIRQLGPEVAGLIIEPIQGEGGDNHFRPEFFIKLRQLCDQHEILLIFDEVQTGIGLTGRFWAHEHFAVRPDLLSFGKKTQVCGVLAGPRLDQVKDNVFRLPSRINSTFGGNLVDMVRCSLILKIIEEEQLIDNAKERGRELLTGLENLAGRYPELISNARGKGLMCAFDLPSGQSRDQFRADLLKEKLLVVGCGQQSIRFRPHLVMTADEVQEALAMIERCAGRFRSPQ